MFLPLEKISFSVLIDKQLTPQTPFFRLVIKKDGKIILGEWSTNVSLSIKDFENGSYEVSVECKDWFGNIKSVDAAKFTISKEHKIEVFLKFLFFAILVLVIILVVFKFKKR